MIYVGMRDSTRGFARIIHSNCLLPVLSDGGLKFLVTSFECFGVCRFTAAAIAVHPACKISSAETAVSLRLADADESKPSRLNAAASHMTKAISRGMT